MFSFFFFSRCFFSSVSCICLEIIISWQLNFVADWIRFIHHHEYKKVNNSNSFSLVFQMSASEIASGLLRLSVHLNLANAKSFV